MSIWWILAQVFGAFTIINEFISYQIKDQRKYLLCTSIANVWWTLMFVFLGLHGSMGQVQALILAAAFGVLRGMVFWWILAKKTKKRKIAGRVALYTCLAVVFASAIIALVRPTMLTQQVIIQGIGLICGLLFVVGQYLPSKHWLRLFVVMYATIILIGSTPLNLIPLDAYGNPYLDAYGNYIGEWHIMAVLIELSKIASVVVFYIIFLFKRKTAEPVVESGERTAPAWKDKLIAYFHGKPSITFPSGVDADIDVFADEGIGADDDPTAVQVTIDDLPDS